MRVATRLWTSIQQFAPLAWINVRTVRRVVAMRYGALWILVVVFVQAEKSNFERIKDIVSSNIPLVEPLIRSSLGRGGGSKQPPSLQQVK